METEFNLSKWIHEDFKDSNMDMIEVLWIKEFINRIKKLYFLDNKVLFADIII